MTSTNGSRQSLAVRTSITCPHCWKVFPPEAALWIAQHPDLVGDPRLGEHEAQRFLPTRFNLDGAAIDARGFPCHGLACPNCHLPVPRAMFEMKPVFLSILGAPACGKSYFLAAMTWRLRQLFPRQFLLNFADSDPIFNYRLHQYEEVQFLNPNRDELVALEKTETHGDLYDTVLFGDQPITFPKPFLFSLRPQQGHPNHKAASTLSHVLCLYDNAGESFLPGGDTATSPVTRHLALSSALFFLFDPTQDSQFRQACDGKTDDPQMARGAERLERERPVRQETIFLEAADRIRRHAGLGQSQKHSRPLIVVVTKYDCWAPLLDNQPFEPPYVKSPKSSLYGLRASRVELVSDQVRSLLWQHVPEMISAVEGFAEQVIYIPVSATGGSPEIDPETGFWGIRPGSIDPQWVEVPLLYVLARWFRGIVPTVRSTGSSGVLDAGQPPPPDGADPTSDHPPPPPNLKHWR